MTEASFAVRGDLQPAESRLIGHSATGTACNVSGEPPEGRRVRAAVIYELCTGGIWSVHAKGVHLVGAVVDGPLDFEFADLRVPLRLTSCDIPADLRLRNATAPTVQAIHCRLGGRVDAGLARLGGLALTGSTLAGPVVLAGAIVERDLDLDGARLAGSGNGGGLVCDGLRVGGGLFAGDGFHAAGVVRLGGAAVGGNVEMAGAMLAATGSPLLADGLRVAGGVSLSRGFEACGAVRLAGATIEGQLSLDGARITGPDEEGAALVADGLRVGGDVFMRDGFSAVGAIHVTGAQVGGSLEFDGASLVPQGAGEAVAGDGLIVRGDLLLTDGFEAGGAVRLQGVTVGGNVELAGARISGVDGTGNSVVCDRIRVGGGLFLGDGFEAAGPVRLVGAIVEGQLTLSSATIVAESAAALVADGVRVGSDAYLDDGFVAIGTVRLEGAFIGGNLSLDGAQLSASSPGGDAIVADNLYVRGDLSMGAGFGAEGAVRLVGAFVAGRLTMAGATIGRAVLSGSRCTELADDEGAWPPEGGLVLRGFRYEAIEDDLGWAHRLAWVRRQGYEAWSPDPYEQLALYYVAVGDEDAACRVRIARDDDELRHLRLVNRRGSVGYRFWRRPFGWLVGYGYRRNRAGWLLVAMLLLAGVVFRWAEADGAMVPDDPATPSTGCGAPHPCFSSAVYGADIVLPIVDFGQDGAWRPVESDGVGPLWVWARWFFIAVGWALASVFVAAFSGLVARSNT